MRLIGLVIGALVMLASAISLAAPDRRLSLETSVMTPSGLLAIAGLRIAIGLVLVRAAPASRAPRTLYLLGVLVIIAGRATPAFGVARAKAVLNWLASAEPLWMRLDAVAGMAIGGFLVYARSEHRFDEQRDQAAAARVRQSDAASASPPPSGALSRMPRRLNTKRPTRRWWRSDDDSPTAAARA